MPDKITELFLKSQHERGMQLAEQSDVLNLMPLPSDGPTTHYIAQFRCTGVLRARDGTVAPAESIFEVGIAFPDDYLRRVQPMRVVTWLGPNNICHPNIEPPVVCLGRIGPGTELVDLLFQLFEIISYNNWSSHDFLSYSGAQWARNHADLFPVDRRPLKRRTLNLQVQSGSQSANDKDTNDKNCKDSKRRKGPDA